MVLKYTQIDFQEPKESNDVRFIALHWIVFELLAQKFQRSFQLKVAAKGNQRPTEMYIVCNFLKTLYKARLSLWYEIMWF